MSTFIINRTWDTYYGVIYMFIFTSLKKLYIGQTIQKLRRRFQEHLRNPPNKYFNSALNEILEMRHKNKFSIMKIDSNKYGTKDGEIVIKVIKKCGNPKKLDEAEKHFIRKYKTYVRIYGIKYGYNINPGGAGRNQLRGILNPSYKLVNKKLLREMITLGYFLIEIAKELEISENTVNDKIYEFWGDEGVHNLTEARVKFGGKDIARARYNRILREAAPTYNNDIDIEILVEKIKKGFFGYEIAKTLGISIGKLFNFLNWIGFANLNEARKVLGGFREFKKREKIRQIECNIRGKDHPDFVYIDGEQLKLLIKNNNSVEQIAKKFKTTISTIYNKINEKWQLSFKQSKRLFRIYPKINENFLNELINDGLSIEDIDSEFLMNLIKRGLKLNDIAKLYERGRASMSIMIRDTLRVKDFDEAMTQYFWIPNLIDSFKLRRSAKEIALDLNKDYITVRSKIKELWKKDFKRLSNFSSLMKFLYDKYAD